MVLALRFENTPTNFYYADKYHCMVIVDLTLKKVFTAKNLQGWYFRRVWFSTDRNLIIQSNEGV